MKLISCDLFDRHDHRAGQSKMVHYHTYLQSLALFVEQTQELIKVIPPYCIAHPYCARFLRHQRAQMSVCTYTPKEISLKPSSIAK